MSSFAALDRKREARQKKPEIPEEGARWISWEEWQYVAIHTYFDGIARRLGHKPRGEWKDFLADHLERRSSRIIAPEIDTDDGFWI